MTGCRCSYVLDEYGFEDQNIVDTTECSIHPLECEALHPETGKNCHHGPGHPGQHAYAEYYTWPNPLSDGTALTERGGQ